jgi:hypothetical protein
MKKAEAVNVNKLRIPPLSRIRDHFEIYALLLFIAAYAVFVLLGGMPVVYPTLSSGLFVSKHYIIPVILAVVAQVILLICMKFSGRSFSEESRRKLLLTILYIPFVAVVLFLHFNFKCWTPLVNPNTYDTLYNDIESAIPVTAWFYKLGSLVDFGGLSSYLYLNLFIFMFILSFVYHTLFDKLVNLRKVVVGTASFYCWAECPIGLCRPSARLYLKTRN